MSIRQNFKNITKFIIQFNCVNSNKSSYFELSKESRILDLATYVKEQLEYISSNIDEVLCHTLAYLPALYLQQVQAWCKICLSYLDRHFISSKMVALQYIDKSSTIQTLKINICLDTLAMQYTDSLVLPSIQELSV